MMFTRSNPRAVRCQAIDMHSVYLPSVKGMHFTTSELTTEFLLNLTYSIFARKNYKFAYH